MADKTLKYNNENIIITEMCDVCGKDCIAPIPRTMYLTKNKVRYIIRHHIWCDPIRFAQTFLEN